MALFSGWSSQKFDCCFKEKMIRDRDGPLRFPSGTLSSTITNWALALFQVTTAKGITMWCTYRITFWDTSRASYVYSHYKYPKEKIKRNSRYILYIFDDVNDNLVRHFRHDLCFSCVVVLKLTTLLPSVCLGHLEDVFCEERNFRLPEPFLLLTWIDPTSIMDHNIKIDKEDAKRPPNRKIQYCTVPLCNLSLSACTC